MDLQQKFKEETDFYAYIENNMEPVPYMPYYVEWLEEQLNKKKRYEATTQRGGQGHCTGAQVFDLETDLSVCSFNSTEDPADASKLAEITADSLNEFNKFNNEKLKL